MNLETVKGKPLSQEETKYLLEMIENSPIITTKTTNATNNKMKVAEWNRIADRFNALSTCRRTPQQLRLKWENLKKNARKRSTKIRMNNIKTGGGTADYIPPDDILDRVTSLLGSTVSGLTVEFGGDGESDVGDKIENEGFATVKVNIDDIIELPCETTTDVISSDTIIATETADAQTPMNILQTPKTPTFASFSTLPRSSGKRKINADHGRTARNLAIAEYYAAKTKALEAQTSNILLQNEKLKLEIEKLKKI